MLSLPVGTASVERSFNQMKQIKTRPRSRLNDFNLARLMRIAIEGPQLEDVNFDEILDILNYSFLCNDCFCVMIVLHHKLGNYQGGGGGNPGVPLPLYETLRQTIGDLKTLTW